MGHCGDVGGLSELLVDSTLYTIYAVIDTRRMGMGNVMGSTANRAIVNTSIVIGNAGANAIASFSNGFRMRYTPNSALIVSCVKCGARRMGTSSGVRMALRRSTGSLRRMIMANCAARGGTSLANSITIISAGGLGADSRASPVHTLRNHIPNVAIAASNSPVNSKAIHVHNVNSFGSSRSPLCVVSNIPAGVTLGALGAGSVRDVRILGSTTSTSVCNSHTSGNIVVVAAGGNGGNDGITISFSTGLATRFCSGRSGVGLVGSDRCTATVTRTTLGSKLSPMTCTTGCNVSLGTTSNAPVAI